MQAAASEICAKQISSVALCPNLLPLRRPSPNLCSAPPATPLLLSSPPATLTAETHTCPAAGSGVGANTTLTHPNGALQPPAAVFTRRIVAGGAGAERGEAEGAAAMSSESRRTSMAAMAGWWGSRCM